MEAAESMNLHSLTRIAPMFIAGIVVGDAWGQHLAWWALVVGGGVLIAVALALGHKHNGWQGACIMACSLLVGAALSMRQKLVTTPIETACEVSYSAIVTSEPQEKGKTIRCDIAILKIDGLPQRRAIKVRATLLKDAATRRWQHLHVGDGIEAMSTLEAPKGFFKPTNFDYPRWLRAHGYRAQTFVHWLYWRKAAVSTTTLSRWERVTLRARKFRQALLERLQQLGIDHEQLAVVAAMTLGDKSHIGNALKNNYSVTGASHVLALSGLHLGIIYALFTLLIGRFWRWRWVAQGLTLATVWAFVVMVGMPISAMRSATMLTVYAVCLLLGRQRASVNTLAFAALTLLVANPLALWDVGFQMSFMAVLSIIVYYQPILSLIKPRWKMARWVWSLCALSVAAQIGTAPLVAYYFGRFSCYFLLTNIIAIPAVTIILYMGILMAMATPAPIIQHFLGTALAHVAATLNGILGHMAQWPGASIEHIRMGTAQLWLVYVVIISITASIAYAIRMRRQRLLENLAVHQ